MTEFRPGDRVRYKGMYAFGELGTVREQTHAENVNVIWDNISLHVSRDSWGVLPENIETIVFDYTSSQTGDTDEDI